ncbi:sugar ABC transporter ATP-binding protein [Pararobbsia silviterrae]|uniref:Sugar ABC transporter ATP-binding protein n=1 Tax=Pararobbsia silviterrae TaxID=1792498 RepID=A0A494XSX8_9BURK|nr:sugar ABC transporter ATP-binding protein [Pararobbsia silviterrae]RKP53730.1 sugar ABC transporter ATP-binding protein [Pararobbsia silviterrae]
MSGQPHTLLSVNGVKKSFGPTSVLDNVSLDVRHNELLGIAGENGAGKSTLLKIMAGVVSPDQGGMTFDGRPHVPANYAESARAGVFMVFQEQALLPNMSVIDNIALGNEAWLRAHASGRSLARVARAQLDELGLSHVRLDVVVGRLPFHVRQMIEIGRAFILAQLFDVKHPVILLDEPTAAIGEREIALLLGSVRKLLDRASFVLITHRLSEYIEFCDRTCVLKDGVNSGEVSKAEISEARLHALMVGRQRNSQFYHEHRQRQAFGAPLIEVQGLDGAGVADVSFAVRAGEIVGIGGLMGCGKEAVVRAFTGHEDFPVKGTVAISGAALPLKRRNAAAVKAGVGVVPKERKTEGAFMYMSVANNIGIAARKRVVGALGLLSQRKERAIAREQIKALGVRTSGPDQLIKNLSGGNQQKVILGRWLAAGVRVLVLDNPTRGVDVGAKEDIYKLLRDLADTDVAILLVSDDILELTGLSNRILVMREGRVSAEFDAPVDAKPTERDLVAMMT